MAGNNETYLCRQENGHQHRRVRHDLQGRRDRRLYHRILLVHS